MATPQPLPAVLDEVEPDIEELDPTKEPISSAMREHLLDEFLGAYQPKDTQKYEPDSLGKKFQIIPGQPLPAFDTGNAKAFLAQNTTDPDQQLYALICERHLPPRMDLADAMLSAANVEPSPLIRLHAAGVTHISTLDEERYVLIYEQPKGKLLIDYVNSQPQAFPDRYVLELVIRPLNEALVRLEKLGFSHGSVNPARIYLHEGKLTLGECCSEPFGYSQDFHYEPINYIQAHPAGKGKGITQVDYFALGAIAALMKLRPPALKITSREVLLRRLLQEGSYIGIAGYVELSEEMNDLLRGTLNDNTHERWTSKQTTEWCKGKRYNLLSPTIPALGTRPFELGEEMFNNMRQLANGVHRYREEALEVLRDTSLGRWIEMFTRRREISDYIQRVTKSYRNPSQQETSEMITRCMFPLDRYAPIRMRSGSMHADGMPTLVAYAYHSKEGSLFEELREAISQSMLSAWQESFKTHFGIATQPDHVQNIIWLCDRSRMHMRNSAYGFGVERLLYDLNPSLPCQSPIIKRFYVKTLPDLLEALDNVAVNADKPTVPMDRHIAGFIGAKTGMTSIMVFNEYSAYPAMTMHKGLVALKLLQKAYISSAPQRFAGLSAWLVASISDVVGSFYSRTVRKTLSEQLTQYAEYGDLTALLQYLTSHDYSIADSQGFVAATQRYSAISTRIKGLGNQDLLEYRAFKMGNLIAKFIGYIIMFIMIIYYFSTE